MNFWSRNSSDYFTAVVANSLDTYIHSLLRSGPYQEYLHHDGAKSMHDDDRLIAQPIGEQEHDYELRK